MLRKNKELITAINFLLRYLALRTTLRKEGDSVTTYVINKTIALRLGSKDYTEKLLVFLVSYKKIIIRL
jgi:hypothetical protein